MTTEIDDSRHPAEPSPITSDQPGSYDGVPAASVTPAVVTSVRPINDGSRPQEQAPMPQTRADPIVRADDVHLSFGDVHALSGATLAIEAGSVYALLGSNGAGKTTLINVLSTLLVPDAGSASVGGDDVVANPKAVRRRVGLAGQFAAVDDYLTGRENVEMVGRLYGLPRARARQKAEQVLERFGLADAADRRAGQYSGGMRRRLDLAASLVGEPEILFLDEPTTGIDPGSRLDIWRLIRELVAGGTTVLLTTQYLEEADELADRIGVIDHGRVVAEGTSDELKNALGANRLHVRVRQQDLEATRRATASFAGRIENDGGEFEFPAADGTKELVTMVRALDAEQIAPLTIALERPTLDDVFLQLTTGRTIEESPR
jgi:ABC-2 type transport system ATP-binding protein